MKLLAVLSTTVYSGHYRGGTYIFSSKADGTTSIQQTQTWNNNMAGTFGTCLKEHEGTVASPGISTACSLIDGSGSCPNQSLMWPYTVTFSSNGEMGSGNDYCYGFSDETMTTPSSGYKIGWSSCCWVGLTNDAGFFASLNSTSMEVYATVFEPTNNSPVFTHPPLWRIMSGCDEQQMNLSPKDPDGDTVKCRWALLESEGGAATYQAAEWPSLSLDGDNCIVTYTGSIDDTQFGVKPVGIMMEDFDANGNIKSSIPVQFLAAVWTPQSSARRASAILGDLVYPEWFAEKDGDHHHDLDVNHNHDHRHKSQEKEKGKKRGRRSTTPAYCSAIPRLTGPTPQDGSILTGETFEITLQAESDGAIIKSFSYEKPAQMSCSSPDQNGSVTCTWTPSDSEQEKTDHGFCFLATDSLGLTTKRRCITLQVSQKDACEDGFEDSNGNCVDIDECAADAHDCHELAACSNTEGSFICDCNPGYLGDGVNACVEIDECAEQTHNCHQIAHCNNTPGSFICDCFDGYRGDGVNTCDEVDECVEKIDNCHKNAICDNTPGSFTCDCREGYRGDGIQKCVEIDECAEQTHNCHKKAYCDNTPGSFTCECFNGYRGDGVTKCADINECAEEIHTCHTKAYCDNTPGSYDCTCTIGWKGNGYNCVDIDECVSGAHTCHEFAFCTNNPGSYDCSCSDGYMGDGFSCTVPCATFYDTAHDAFMANVSAFSTGTFDVSNLATFETEPSQADGNWKPDSGFNNKASFVTVKPKCTLEGFSGLNFYGKKLGKWQGK